MTNREAATMVDVLAAARDAERECERDEQRYERRLRDFTWRNCTHSVGRGHDDWLACWRCHRRFNDIARSSSK